MIAARLRPDCSRLLAYSVSVVDSLETFFAVMCTPGSIYYGVLFTQVSLMAPVRLYHVPNILGLDPIIHGMIYRRLAESQTPEIINISTT